MSSLSEPRRPRLLPQNRKLRHLRGIWLRNLSFAPTSLRTADDADLATSKLQVVKESSQLHPSRSSESLRKGSVRPDALRPVQKRRTSLSLAHANLVARQRNLETLYEEAVGDVFYSLHVDADAEPVYISEVRERATSFNFRFFSLEDCASAISRCHSMILRIWARRPKAESWIFLLEETIDLRRLNFIGTLMDRTFPPNALIFHLEDGVYSFDFPNKISEPKQAPQVATSSYNALMKLANLESSIEDAIETQQRLTEEINRILDESPPDNSQMAQEAVAMADKYVTAQRRSNKQAQKKRDDLQESIRSRRQAIVKGRELQNEAEKDMASSREKLTASEELLEQTQQQIRGQRRRICADLSDIFPITPIPNAPPLSFQICNIPLPNSIYDAATARNISEDLLSAGLGVVALLTKHLQFYLAHPLPYPLDWFGSRSYARDDISQLSDRTASRREFPLYLPRGGSTAGQWRFEYAWFLLNKDIEALCSSQGLRVVDIRHTLPNLKYLLYVCSAGSDQVPERKKGGVRGLWAGRIKGRMSTMSAQFDGDSGSVTESRRGSADSEVNQNGDVLRDAIIKSNGHNKDEGRYSSDFISIILMRWFNYTSFIFIVGPHLCHLAAFHCSRITMRQTFAELSIFHATRYPSANPPISIPPQAISVPIKHIIWPTDPSNQGTTTVIYPRVPKYTRVGSSPQPQSPECGGDPIFGRGAEGRLFSCSVPVAASQQTWYLATMLGSSLTLALAVAVGAVSVPRNSPVVELKNGSYYGIHNHLYNQDLFLGMRYAQAPLNDLRFRHPQPLNSTWNGVRNATEYQSKCYQYGYPSGPLSGGTDDCLHLNVVRPSVAAKEKLPVLVWIHGGGLVGGYSGDPSSNLSYIIDESVKLGSPIIDVSVNYRLGAWGFLWSSAVKAAGVGNNGFRDQRLALQWVQENIAAFGGDPTKVTIWGQSGGARSIASQLTAFGGRDDGLFRAAILESGTGFPTAFGEVEDKDAPTFENGYKTLLKRTNCDSAKDSLQCLRKVPSLELAQIVGNVSFPVWLDIIDGDFIRDSRSELVRHNKFVPVPIINGVASDDGDFFAQRGINTTQEWEAYLRKEGASKATIEAISALYPDIPRVGLPATFQGRPLGPLASYHFDVVAGDRPAVQGAGHSVDIPFVFRNYERLAQLNATKPRPGSLDEVAVKMSRMWISFASKMNPNFEGMGDVQWPEYEWDGGKNMVFHIDDSSVVHVENDTYRTEQMEYLDKKLWKVELQSGLD
ncbi:UV radiation resistance associated p63 [Fusarium circinatum]|uniref:UV radiation resistance associated p63 n=1 Tax=Fusarium circinatum TaxID=48490 RepID=A0A8H5XAN2_FUSCI|nr:UV radiation resistance associated p63 [Fusarium circinatum]